MGRIIGDGGRYFVLGDIAVYPQHQRKGVGTQIMDALMDYIEENTPPKSHISLTASSAAAEFFVRYGFKAVRMMQQTAMHFAVR